MKVRIFGIVLALGLSYQAFSQDYVWNGNSGTSDFFDENNWGRDSDGQAPAQGMIDPSKPIDLNLLIQGSVDAEDLVQFGTGSLEISQGELFASDITGGEVIIGEKGYLTITGTAPVLENTNIDLNSPLCWIRTSKVRPVTIQAQYLDAITYKQSAVSYPSTIRIDNYYTNGAVIRPLAELSEPMQIFSQASLSGTNGSIQTDSVYSGSNIPGGLNNAIASFRLSRGFMATLAVEEDGTGKSKVYIASEKDLLINEMPPSLSEGISFIRVVPWNWVSKRGTGGNIAGLDNTWYYRWSNSDESDLQREYAPMAWGHTSADDDSDIMLYRSIYKATHVMGFNEPDNCNDQSGQYGNLCIPDTAVKLYRNLMKTGLRTVSPGCREGAWDDWLFDFFQLAVAQDIRIDVIAVHWYDWGSSPANSPNADPENVFNRFKKYLDDVYKKYGLPIWITEFNANPNRTTLVQLEFMKKALPYLESLSYVERYCWFQPVSGVGDYYNSSGALTPVGEVYKTEPSFPAIPENTWAASNNLTLGSNQMPVRPEIASSLVLFPNPVSAILNLSSDQDILELAVYTLNGQKIFMGTKGQTMIDTGNFESGVYVLRVNNTFRKFIKL